MYTFLLYVAQYFTEYEILEKLLNLKNFSLNIFNIAVLLAHSNSKGRFCKSCPVNFEFRNNMTTLSTIVISHQNISEKYLDGKELHCKGKLVSRLELCPSQFYLNFSFV